MLICAIRGTCIFYDVKILQMRELRFAESTFHQTTIEPQLWNSLRNGAINVKCYLSTPSSLFHLVKISLNIEDEIGIVNRLFDTERTLCTFFSFFFPSGNHEYTRGGVSNPFCFSWHHRLPDYGQQNISHCTFERTSWTSRTDRASLPLSFPLIGRRESEMQACD